LIVRWRNSAAIERVDGLVAATTPERLHKDFLETEVNH
jgi:hypothetical protein